MTSPTGATAPAEIAVQGYRVPAVLRARLAPRPRALLLAALFAVLVGPQVRLVLAYWEWRWVA